MSMNLETQETRSGKKRHRLAMDASTAGAFLFVALLLVACTAITLVVIAQRGNEGREETRTVAKCSFQFTAYRAQVSQQTNTALRPVKGLDPYAGLVLPPPSEIKKHLADNCQKYLKPFVEAAKEGP